MSLPGIPETVRKKAIAAGAEDWLAGLPALVAHFEREWSLSVGRILHGGSEALVAEAVLADGELAVLKLLVPHDQASARNEIAVLRLAGGEGCARLLQADEEREAMLLERLGRPLGESGVTLLERLEILCATARRLWRPALGAGFPTGAEKGRWLVGYITSTWDELARPCSEAAVAYAIACAERRIAAHDDERAVLVHGDIHEWNALQSEDGYKLIDPDGLVAEPEYDLGVIMRADPIDPTNPHAASRWLAQHTGLDEDAIWEWAAVERLSTGLVCTGLDLQPFARNVLASADLAAPAD